VAGILSLSLRSTHLVGAEIRELWKYLLGPFPYCFYSQDPKLGGGKPSSAWQREKSQLLDILKTQSSL